MRGGHRGLVRTKDRFEETARRNQLAEMEVQNMVQRPRHDKGT